MPITVVANPIRLTWNHFRVVKFIPRNLSAQTSTQFFIPGFVPEKMTTKRVRMPSVTIRVEVNTQDTQVLRTANRTNDLLQHEQGHYDLWFLVSRALARELESIETDSLQDLISKFRQVKTLHDEHVRVIEAAYDQQTDHHRNRPGQLRWDAAIAQAMRDPRSLEVAGFPL